MCDVMPNQIQRAVHEGVLGALQDFWDRNREALTAMQVLSGLAADPKGQHMAKAAQDALFGAKELVKAWKGVDVHDPFSSCV